MSEPERDSGSDVPRPSTPNTQLESLLHELRDWPDEIKCPPKLTQAYAQMFPAAAGRIRQRRVHLCGMLAIELLGTSRSLGNLGPKGLADRLQKFESILQPILSRHGASLLQSGGSCAIATFSDVESAALCAGDIVQGFSDRSTPEEPWSVRQAVHFGRVAGNEQFAEIGASGPLAAALSVASPGEVCLSEPADARLAQQNSPLSARIVTRGEVFVLLPPAAIGARTAPPPAIHVGSRRPDWVFRDSTRMVNALVTDGNRAVVRPLFVEASAGNTETPLTEPVVAALRETGLECSEKSLGRWWLEDAGNSIPPEKMRTAFSVAYAAAITGASIDDDVLIIGGDAQKDLVSKLAGYTVQLQQKHVSTVTAVTSDRTLRAMRLGGLGWRPTQSLGAMVTQLIGGALCFGPDLLDDLQISTPPDNSTLWWTISPTAVGQDALSLTVQAGQDARIEMLRVGPTGHVARWRGGSFDAKLGQQFEIPAAEMDPGGTPRAGRYRFAVCRVSASDGTDLTDNDWVPVFPNEVRDFGLQLRLRAVAVRQIGALLASKAASADVFPTGPMRHGHGSSRSGSRFRSIVPPRSAFPDWASPAASGNLVNLDLW